MKIAAFTMVYNDAVFLPIWCTYYGRALGEENLFVLDHGSSDGSTRNVGRANVLHVPRSKHYDEDQRANFVSRCQAKLLAHYDAVVFSDADEILIPDPTKFDTLVDFIKSRGSPFVNGVGLNICHLHNTEKDIDLAQPILAQRKYVFFSAPECKPLIATMPLIWGAGFHSCNYAPSIDQDLFLFHLKCMDMKLALNRLRTTRALSWSANARMKGHGKHHRFEDQEFISQMFPDFEKDILPRLIPDFDFSEDLTKCMTDRPGQFNSYEGAFAEIPPRFKYLIEGTTVQQNMDIGARSNRINGVHICARRALRRLIAVNMMRDRCRTLVNYARQIFKFCSRN